MKKTLLALAVLGAAAGTAVAADVQLYGVLDYGLKYTHTDNDDGTDATDKLEMATGSQSGPRWGLTASEELGNGLKVGFNLENGFNADDGTLGNNGRLFGRICSMYVEGNYGRLIFGREGQLNSANGTVGISGIFTPFGASWGGAPEISTFFVGASRIDNSITYKTPTVGGFSAYAQYSFDMNTREDTSLSQTEGKSSSNRYAALAAQYKAGPANFVAIADWYNWSSTQADRKDVDDGYSITAGGNYDLGAAKVYAGVQYFDNMIKATSADVTTKDTFAKIGTGINGQIKGYGVMAGVDTPVLGGTAMFAVGYTSTEEADPAADVEKTESDRWGVGVGYTYNLSKRTNLYGVAAYYQDELKNEHTANGDRDRDPSSTSVVIGIRHKF